MLALYTESYQRECADTRLTFSPHTEPLMISRQSDSLTFIWSCESLNLTLALIVHSFICDVSPSASRRTRFQRWRMKIIKLYILTLNIKRARAFGAWMERLALLYLSRHSSHFLHWPVTWWTRWNLNTTFSTQPRMASPTVCLTSSPFALAAPGRKTNDLPPTFNHARVSRGLGAILPLRGSNERWIIGALALNTHP